MKHLFIWLWTVLISLMALGCGLFEQEEENSDTSDQDGYTGVPYAKLTESAIGVTESDVASMLVEENRIVFPAGHPIADQLILGSVLVGGSADTPLLYQVTYLDQENGNPVAGIGPAALTDAFEELHVAMSSINGSYSGNNMSINGITIDVNQTKNFPWEYSLNKSFEVAAGITAGLEGQFKFEPGAEIIIDIQDSVAKQIKFLLMGTYDTTLKQYVQVQESISKQYSMSIMPKTRLCTFIVPVPPLPFPLFISVYGSIEGGLELSIEGSLNVNFGQRTSGNLRMGFTYQNQTLTAIGSDPLDFTAIPPSLEANTKAVIKPYIKPRLDVRFLAAGPFMALECYGKLTMEAKGALGEQPSACGSATIAAGISGYAGGSVSVFGYSKELEAQLLDFSSNIWPTNSDGNECDTDTGLDLGTDTDNDYPYYSVFSDQVDYEVVAYGADLTIGSSASIMVTIGDVAERTSDVSGTNSTIWDEVVYRGTANDIATTWKIGVNGGTSCRMDVTPEMVEEWGGVSLSRCGTLTNVAFHFNPIN